MHRFHLLKLLESYAERFPAEAATGQFLDFVHRNERCFERDLWEGHVTGSAWLVDGSARRVLLTHHRKLRRWLQLGGHSDGNPWPLAVAMQEAREESGLDVVPLSREIFDLDIHEIPARKQDPAHLHYDVRFALQVSGDEDFQISAESLDLAWVPIDEMGRYTDEPSMLRMAAKWRVSDFI
jgi:8-oxo-dGTP pyrophosphatase MutT (NUDIX family)